MSQIEHILFFSITSNSSAYAKRIFSVQVGKTKHLIEGEVIKSFHHDSIGKTVTEIKITKDYRLDFDSKKFGIELNFKTGEQILLVGHRLSLNFLLFYFRTNPSHAILKSKIDNQIVRIESPSFYTNTHTGGVGISGYLEFTDFYFKNDLINGFCKSSDSTRVEILAESGFLKECSNFEGTANFGGQILETSRIELQENEDSSAYPIYFESLRVPKDKPISVKNDKCSTAEGKNLENYYGTIQFDKKGKIKYVETRVHIGQRRTYKGIEYPLVYPALIPSGEHCGWNGTIEKNFEEVSEHNGMKLLTENLNQSNVSKSMDYACSLFGFNVYVSNTYPYSVSSSLVRMNKGETVLDITAPLKKIKIEADRDVKVLKSMKCFYNQIKYI